MTTRKYSSRSQQTTLAANLTDTATSCTVVSGSALLGGASVTAGTTFTVVIDPDTALEEIVDVTVVSTNVLTITRGIENSGTGQAHSAGAAVRHMAIGRDFREANLHIEATGGYNDGTGAHTMHGIAAGEGVVVGTDKTQTLTAKTLTAPTISDPTFTGTPNAAASIRFEGAVADDYETTLTVVEPTQDNTITLPNTTGTVVVANAAQTLTNKTMGDALNAGGFKITNLATPTDASDAVRKDFADAQVAAAATSAASAATSAASAATSASSALTSANSASASQTAAATSAASAATSASTMAASVTAAASSATAAATSATSAAASATTAANSATAAATSATSAAASATAAATSATSAAASATTAANSVATIAGYASSAATSEANAAASATAAATSATSAAASTSAAAASATAAATSATSAAASATAAATSATSSAASATAAATSATSAAASAASAAAVLNQAFDAKGDLLVGTGVDTFDQLGVGTNGYLLTADSAEATGIKWAAAPVSLPSQTGNAGEFLTTDGTNASWAAVAGSLAQPTEPTSPTDGQIWIDTDGTAPTTVVTRWSKAPTAGTTTLTGTDDGSTVLAYTPGYEEVFLNGVLLSRTNDYTASTGTSVVLSVATVAGDIVEIICPLQVAYTDAITTTAANAAYVPKTLTTTTGDIIYASAANTPARLGIGSTDQVLKVSGGVPAWATASSGALTLITRQSFSNVAGTGTTFDGIFTSTYKTYLVVIENISGVTFSDDLQMQFRYAGPTTQAASYYGSSIYTDYSTTTVANLQTNNAAQATLNSAIGTGGAGDSTGYIWVQDVGNSSYIPRYQGSVVCQDSNIINYFGGITNTARVYTGLLFKSSSTNVTGTVAVYGLATA
jgi:hypothetical protein